MRNVGYVDKLVTSGRGKGVSEASLRELRRYSANFAKWRWGTLFKVVTDQDRVAVPFRESWEKSEFSLKEKGFLSRYCPALQSVLIILPLSSLPR